MPAKTLSRPDSSKADLWVFGYGSLMWRPGFEFVEQVPARLIGEHRALCVYSFDHRGTPEKPGLVLGLDRGGACRGVAFRVAAKRRDATVDYLRDREQTTNVYREVMRSVWLENEARQRVSALAYVVDRGHVQYAGRLSLAEQLRYVQPGARPFRKQSRLRAVHREIDRGARFSRPATASARGDAARVTRHCFSVPVLRLLPCPAPVRTIAPAPAAPPRPAGWWPSSITVETCAMNSSRVGRAAADREIRPRSCRDNA